MLDYFVDGHEKFRKIQDEMIGAYHANDFELGRVKSKMKSIRNKLQTAVKNKTPKETIYYTLYWKGYDIECGEITTCMESRRETFVRNDKIFKK